MFGSEWKDKSLLEFDFCFAIPTPHTDFTSSPQAKRLRGAYLQEKKKMFKMSFWSFYSTF